MKKILYIIGLAFIIYSCQNFEEIPEASEPISITITNEEPVCLSLGIQKSINFYLHSPNTLLNLDNIPQQIELLSDSSCFKLINVEHVQNNDTPEVKNALYRAIIEDTQISLSYDKMANLMLNTIDDSGQPIQILSNAFEVIGVGLKTLPETGLPRIAIKTPNAQPIKSKEEYLSGCRFTLINTNNTISSLQEMKIKGRGNTTWGAPKKPYKIHFDKKVTLFGEPASKKWVLLANHYDKSLLRTDLAFWMAKTFGQFDYVPNFHFADLILNGAYVGTYQFGDNLEIDTHRVNVGKDGFLLEIDGRAEEPEIFFRVEHIARPITIKEPDVEIGNNDYKYVVDYLTKADAALFSDDWLDEKKGYKSLIDIQSFAEWYLMMEITKNNDAAFFSSCYMNLTRNGKLKMGPLWDFDISLGGYPFGYEYVNEPEGFQIKTSAVPWFTQLFKDPAFVEIVKQRFNSYYNNQDKIIAHIETSASTIKQSAIANNTIWGALGDKKYTTTEAEQAYSEQEYLKQWVVARLEWLKQAFDKM